MDLRAWVHYVSLFNLGGLKLAVILNVKDIKRGVKLQKMIHGASHERNLRAGTENILLIAGLGNSQQIRLYITVQ